MARARETSAKRYDFVYCAGLFDYFTDSVCRRLIALFYEWLVPGGLLSVTNIHPSNPQRHLMEYLLEWNVFHRTEKELESLATPEGEREVIADRTGVNIFLNIRKNR
ncbi:MAG: class I SAM-dependent methyltransferase, partial [Verrucomicrobia bacterium]|nr:class I SAM-dependent methyltransferase [Verrucomicrobiota bacterium]